jgi:hypothetical protein
MNGQHHKGLESMAHSPEQYTTALVLALVCAPDGGRGGRYNGQQTPSPVAFDDEERRSR